MASLLLAVAVALVAGSCTLDRAPLVAGADGASGSGSITGASSSGNIQVPAPPQFVPTASDAPADCTNADGDTRAGGAHCPSIACTDGASVNAAALELCNGRDDDCDGLVDEGDGACDPGARCTDGTCRPTLPPGASCTDHGQCETNHCDGGYCCGAGSCCSSASDCPGYIPEGERTCLEPDSCSGERSDVVCNGDFQCETVVTSDDAACDGSLRSCGGYADAQCPAQCASSCQDDDDCAADRPCVDGVCCESACEGTCEACNADGQCVPIEAGLDPDDECDALDCAGFFVGWSGPVCVARANADASKVACDGARACQSADVVCPSQPTGPIVGACPQDCSAPVAGTCTDTVQGVCLIDTSCVR